MAYLNVDEVESALIALAASHPGICELINLPNTTVEGRTCHALRIGQGAAIDRDGVLFTGSVHAREWGGADICINFATDLLEAYVGGTGLTYGGKSFNASQIRSVVEGLNVYVFPDVNPDGRHYSQNNEALWRRNRNPAQSRGNPKCIGVDLNRNHDFLWDFPNLFSPSAFVHTSTDPCDMMQTYCGPSPVSEQETKNIVWMLDQYPRIRWYVDLHSYGEDILYSWGDDGNQSDDPSMNFANPAYNSVRGVDGDTAYREFIPSADLSIVVALANRIHDAIQAVRGSNYETKQSFDLYATSGAGDDYAYSRNFVNPAKGKVYAFTIEWGANKYGFQPPWNEMEKIISDITSGLVEFCLEAPCSG